MDNKVCFLFGYATTPYKTIVHIEATAERHYEKCGIRAFVVGDHRDFDHYAATAIGRLKRRYTDIVLLLFAVYHPGERPPALMEAFDNAYCPPLESVSRRYAIVKANQYVVNVADPVIWYVKYVGSSSALLKYAHRRQKKERIPVENLADNL